MDSESSPEAANRDAGWPGLLEVAASLGAALSRRGWMFGCAESCTGGLVAAAVTSLAGSSGWFERALVTYSNAAKRELLGVPPDLLERDGAVSESVALAMARGVLERAPVQAALAITGIAGPGGGSADKPVGLVWFAWGLRTPQCLQLQAQGLHWPGDRQAVRMAAARHALLGLRERVERAG